MMSHGKLVEKNETELERSISSRSLTPLLCLLDDAQTKSSIESKKKSCDHARKLIGSDCHDSSSSRWNRFKSWVGSCSLMDAHSDLSVHSPVEFRKKTFTGQQKKDELEREVTMLHKMLSPEEKVHEYLERLHSREDRSARSILDFLPSKTKEIVAELAIVETEIARLESQIKQVQHHNDDMNVHKNTYNRWGHRRTLKNHFDASPLPPNPQMSRRSNKSAATTTLDKKALHFISKPIKGDYHLTDFSTNFKIVLRKTCLKEEKRGCYEKIIPKEMAYRSLP